MAGLSPDVSYGAQVVSLTEPVRLALAYPEGFGRSVGVGSTTGSADLRECR